MSDKAIKLGGTTIALSLLTVLQVISNELLVHTKEYCQNVIVNF